MASYLNQLRRLVLRINPNTPFILPSSIYLSIMGLLVVRQLLPAHPSTYPASSNIGVTANYHSTVQWFMLARVATGDLSPRWFCRNHSYKSYKNSFPSVYRLYPSHPYVFSKMLLEGNEEITLLTFCIFSPCLRISWCPSL